MNYTLIRSAIDKKETQSIYDSLVTELKWSDGIKTRHGDFTRLAHQMSTYDALFFMEGKIITIIEKTLLANPQYANHAIAGLYFNYYKDGDMYCPVHRHPHTTQLVISLGATRTFILGSIKIQVNDGDIIIFNDQLHGVPKEKTECDGRISVATFLVPIKGG